MGGGRTLKFFGHLFDTFFRVRNGGKGGGGGGGGGGPPLAFPPSFSHPFPPPLGNYSNVLVGKCKNNRNRHYLTYLPSSPSSLPSLFEKPVVLESRSITPSLALDLPCPHI